MADRLLTSPLNRQPEGLLDFFELKSMGQYPQTFNPDLRGIMDLTRWYSDHQSLDGRANMVLGGASAGANDVDITSADWTVTGGFNFAPTSNPSGGLQTTVPQDEIWMLLEAALQVHLPTGAGTTTNATLVCVRYQSGSWTNLTDSALAGFDQSVAGFVRTGQRCCTRAPLFLMPGYAIRVRHGGLIVAAGQIDAQVSLRIVPLKR